MAKIERGFEDRPGLIDPRITLDRAGVEPTWYFPTWHAVDVDGIADHGVEHILIDLDGCITPAYEHDYLDLTTLRIVSEMHKRFKTVNLATNNLLNVEFLRDVYGFDNIFQSWDEQRELPYKPHPKFYGRILRDLAVDDPSTILMMGDNPDDDIRGASELGIRTALIDCLDPNNFFGYVE